MDPFIGEIRMWPGTRCPVNWHFCDGTLLKVNDYQALFALLGTRYGGDGASTFGLPDLRGRLPIHQGTGTNLTPRVIGQQVGSTTVTLTSAQMPSHSHYYNASTATAEGTSPAGAVTGDASAASGLLYTKEAAAGNQVTLDAVMVGSTGGGQAHSNMMPTIALNMIISLAGIFPSQN